MQCVNLTDDELWQAIAHNTTVMSYLVLSCAVFLDGII